MFLFCLVFAMFCARLFICALWSPAGKGLTSWLSFVLSSVSLSLSHWYPGSGVVLDCIVSWSLQPYYFAIISLTHRELVALFYRLLAVMWLSLLCVSPYSAIDWSAVFLVIRISTPLVCFQTLKLSQYVSDKKCFSFCIEVMANQQHV